MKHLLRDEVVFQKMTNPHDTKRIQRLQQLMDASELTIKDFQDTGIIMERGEFESLYAVAPELHQTCTDVCRYVGGFFIQMLNTGRFYLKYANYRGKYADKIDELEAVLWERINTNNNGQG